MKEGTGQIENYAVRTIHLNVVDLFELQNLNKRAYLYVLTAYLLLLKFSSNWSILSIIDILIFFLGLTSSKVCISANFVDQKCNGNLSKYK